VRGVSELRYYGIDWIAMTFTLIAIYLLGNKSRAGFGTMMCGNFCWMVLGFLTGSIALVIANFTFFGMNIRGYIKWGKEDVARST
tara:strand:+ start:138 stop:392 length:255 start_codon:yes stop_codon:yes gene_type:complete